MRRLCKVCDKLFSPEQEGMEILQSSRGTTTIRDRKNNLIHILVSQPRTLRYLARQKAATEAKVEVVLIKQATPPPAPSTPVVEPPDVSDQLVAAAVEQRQQPEPEWFPQPWEWFTATIKKTPGSDLIISELSNGDEVFAYRDKINGPNGHGCLPQRGDEVSVRIVSRQGDGKAPWKAVEVSLQKEYMVPELPEAATIKWWKETWGTARRDCGCDIHISLRWDISALQHGDRVEVSDYKLDEQGRIKATTCTPLWGINGDDDNE